VPLGDAVADQLVTRVGDQRRACVADERDTGAAGEIGQDAGALFFGVVLVIGAQRAADAVVGDEGPAVAGILAINDVGAGECGEGAQRDVGQIPDGRGDEIKTRCKWLSKTADEIG